ncbi:Flp pilus assembly protein CpaB [Carboxydocella sporoproducens DSM 16521]|uniref:Flp pilus assembly protein CpaB n=2 Tax=Carboxydocella TaxID=178898 RepID=A0A1T4M264_9FIRM|nr:Flp pilus assembly protein CpaB [Carboxydocella thermautotrophica]AVX31500.1 Flp pilus assembly protein CpaB [Carboxydocella thermautotrophica]GAW28835.1 SAF domain-containing protein [Carboxydocella sp. ULO1]GAW32717.1 SAF domain-containing protein [Carboxydocella sp. JDF658]SJZ61021.1 Flp pilus assembly protein CpaB [Carboxydocella sporoproducens DSM 16521]
MVVEKSFLKKNLSLVLAILFALVSFLLLQKYVNSMIQPETAVVATRNIKSGELFSADSVKVEEIPRKGVIPGVIRNPGALVGKRAAYPLLAGQQISETAVKSGQGELQVGPDQRVVAIKATLTNSLGGRLHKGDKVDIFVRWQDKNSGLVYSQPLLSGITVLGVLDDQGRDFEQRQKDVLDKGGRLMPGAVLLAIEQKRVAEVLRYEVLGELVLAGSTRLE